MAMSWFWLIFIAVNLFSFNGLLDKFFCGKKFKNIYAFATSVYLLTAIFMVGLSFFVDFSRLYGWPLFMAIASGPIYFLMWIFYWKALTTTEVSRAVAIFNTAPIFNALLAVVFLNERLISFKWLAIFLIVVGAVICSWENKVNERFNRAYFLVILSAIAGAIGNVVSKFAAFQIDALALYPISFFVSLPLYLFLLTKKEVASEVKVALNDGKTVGTLFLRSLISFLAVCLFYLALKTGPISLIAAVNGIGPLLVFIYSIIVSLFWPKFIKEELGSRVLFSKAVAIILIVVGVILINQ